MCLPPATPAAIAPPDGARDAALELVGDTTTKGQSGWAMPKFVEAHRVFPLDKRLNYIFEDLPGVSLSPVYLLELPATIFLSYLYWSEFRLALMKPMFALYLFREIFGMSLSLHRYFSHKGFRCGRMTQFVLYWIGCLASQGPPLWWASKHRKHHGTCDTAEDPHTPVHNHPLYAWVGWVYLPGSDGPLGRGVDEEYIQDHLKFPELAWGENFHMVPVFLNHLVCYKLGGMPCAIFVSMWSGIICQLATMYFNVAFHTPEEGGSHEADGECHARDIPLDPLSNVFGEAYHAWHHVHPRAHHRPGLDLPYYLAIKPMLMLGIFKGDNIMHQSAVAVHGFATKEDAQKKKAS